MATQAEKVAPNGKAAQAQDAGQPEAQPEELKNLNYELLMLGLSLLSVFNLLVLVLAWDQDIIGIINIIDIPLTVIFFIDFLIRLGSAKSKSEYFFRQFGWADLAASLPLPAFKALRLFRVVRAVRMIRRFGFRNLMRQISNNRADAAIALLTFAIICVLEFGSMAVIAAERENPDANIKNASDAIWWAYVSITTVGYGDRFPTTDWGRFVGVIVLTTGVGLFGVFTGYLATAFLSPSKKKEEEKPEESPPDPQAMLNEIKRLTAEQEKAQEELRAVVAQLRDDERRTADDGRQVTGNG
jgi:voltage-gated potassium channel